MQWQITTKQLYIPLLAAFIAITFTFNLLGFPAFSGDEGTYISRSWAFLTENKLDTGTYWYDHAPLGWVFLSPFLFVFNNLLSVESILVSGRLFIFILNSLTLLFLYFITHKLTNNKIISLTACAIYTSSAIQILFGRRMILDNIMTFWVFAALFLIFKTNKNNRYKNIGIALSAVLFAISVLTKENAVLFGLPFVTLIWYKYRSLKHVLMWVIISGLIILCYPLFAYLRGEFFLNSYIEEGGKPSLLSTLKFQSERGKVSILNWEESFFWRSFRYWLKEDALIFIAGVLASVINLLKIKKDKSAFIISLFVIVQMAFFMRGGLVFEFYIVPLIPFFALNIAYILNALSQEYKKYIYIFITIFLFLNLLNTTKIEGVNAYTYKPTQSQLQAIDWIKKNSGENNITIVDSYAKADLYVYKKNNVQSAFDMEYSWNLIEEIENNTKEVDYIMYTKTMGDFIEIFNLNFTKRLLEHKEKVAEFGSGKENITIYYITPE